MRFVAVWIGLALATMACGPGTGGETSDEVDGGGGSGAVVVGAGGSSGGSGGVARDAGNGGAGGGTPMIKPLVGLEPKVVGAWSRYHAYDGSTDNLILNKDRTGCMWTRINGGNKSIDPITKWSMYNSEVVGAHSGDKYDSAEDQILQGGYDNLRMSRTSGSCPN